MTTIRGSNCCWTLEGKQRPVTGVMFRLPLETRWTIKGLAHIPSHGPNPSQSANRGLTADKIGNILWIGSAPAVYRRCSLQQADRRATAGKPATISDFRFLPATAAGQPAVGRRFTVGRPAARQRSNTFVDTPSGKGVYNKRPSRCF